MSDASYLASHFHRVYEELAPKFGYETRPESAVPWSQLPDGNRGLMVATVQRLLDEAFIVVLPADTMPSRAASACRNARTQMTGESDWFSWVPEWLDRWATKLAAREETETDVAIARQDTP